MKARDIDCYDYGARFYDPALARFMTIDPWAEKYKSWSPYVYALNNPIKFVDVNGCGAGNPLKKMQLRGHYSTWGTSQSKFGKVRGTNYHQGYDLYAPKGTSVNSVGAGKVTKVETHKDFGKMVTVKYSTLTKNDGTEVKDVYVRYAHLSETSVEKGDDVTAESVVGKTGQTGNAKGQSADKAHLHIEFMTVESPTTGEEGNKQRHDPGDFLTTDDAVKSEQTGKESDWTTTEATTTETTTTTTTEDEKKQ